LPNTGGRGTTGTATTSTLGVSTGTWRTTSGNGAPSRVSGALMLAVALVCTELLLLVELGVVDSVREDSTGEDDGLEDIEEKPLLISAVPENGACAPEPNDEVDAGAEEEEEEENEFVDDGTVLVGAVLAGAVDVGWLTAPPGVVLTIDSTPGATSGAAPSWVSGSSLGVLLSALASGAAEASCAGASAETGSALAGGVSF
jgi:hypothetical protein